MDDKVSRYVNIEPMIKDLTAMKRVYDAILLDGIIKALEEQAVEDVAPVVHAEWEHRYNDFGEQIDDRWYCSQCAGCNEYRRTWHCPECGAKMDGKETE